MRCQSSIASPLSGTKSGDWLKTAYSNSMFKSLAFDDGKIIAAGRAVADGVDCSYLSTLWSTLPIRDPAWEKSSYKDWLTFPKVIEKSSCMPFLVESRSMPNSAFVA